jgi:Rab-like protein 5
LISNLLAGHSEKLTSENYSPTVGVRILEFEIKIKGVPETLNIMLWDSSGDHKYENCWKAVMNETDGVVLVYNPDAPSQDQHQQKYS